MRFIDFIRSDMFIVVGFLIALICAFIFFFMYWKKANQYIELEKKMDEEITSAKSIAEESLTRIENKVNGMIKRTHDLLNQSKELYIGGKSYYVRCLISEDIKVQLYSYINHVKASYPSEERDRIHQILKLLLFIPVPQNGFLPVSFRSHTPSGLSHGCEYFADIYCIEIENDVDWSPRYHSHSLYMIELPRIYTGYENEYELPQMSEYGKPQVIYKVPWMDIISDYCYLFLNIDRFIEFIESLYKHPKHLDLIYNSEAVTNKTIENPGEGFQFDPDWLREQGGSNHGTEEVQG